MTLFIFNKDKLSIGVEYLTNKEKDRQAKKPDNQTNKYTDKMTIRQEKKESLQNNVKII